jgi:hypothetical protein
MEPATHRRSHADFTLSRADGAGMKIMVGLVISISFALYVAGYVDGRTRQIQAPTAIHQLPQ